MLRVTCKACNSNKQFFSRYNATDWMYAHYTHEHRENPGNFALIDFFVIEGRVRT